MGSSSVVLYYSARATEGHKRRRLDNATLCSVIRCKTPADAAIPVCRIQKEHIAGRHVHLATGATVAMAAQHKGLTTTNTVVMRQEADGFLVHERGKGRTSASAPVGAAP